MQASNTNNSPNDPFYNFINYWCLPIGVISLTLGLITYLPLFTYIGLGLMFINLLLGDITE